MKHKAKQLTAIATAVTMCAGSLFAFTACGDASCAHDYDWTVKIAPTCAEKGLDTGVCKLCNGTAFRETDTDASKHAYGEWDIEKPTTAQAGKATKICSVHTGNAKLEVELPAIGSEDAGYTQTTIKAPTDADEGESIFTLANAAGDIRFIQKTPATGVTSVARAVEVVAAKKSLVRSGSAKVTEYGFRDPVSGKEPHSSTLGYEFGSGYMHYQKTTLNNTTDGTGFDYVSYEGEERWFSVENDALVGLEYDLTGNLVMIEDCEDEMIGGYGFRLAVTDGDTKYYGAEAFLAGLYDWASLNENGDFTEKLSTENGVTKGEFFFGAYNSNWNQLTLTTVSFTLSSVNSLKTLNVISEVYAQTNSSGKNNFEQTDDGWRLTENAAESSYYLDQVALSQTLFTDLPSNPFDLDSLLVDSFKVYKTVEEEKEITDPGDPDDPDDDVTDTETVLVKGDELLESDVLEMEVKQSVRLMLGEVLPQTASFVFDKPKMYLRTQKGDQYLDPFNWSSNYTSSYYDGILTLRAKVAGEVTFVIKTVKAEKVIKANVKPATPNLVETVVYNYQEESASYATAISSEVTVYAGLDLPVGVSVGIKDEYNYIERDLPWINSAVTVTAADSSNNPVALTESTIGEKKVMVFSSNTVGDYTVTVTSDADATVSCVLTVHVAAAPAVSELLNGKMTNSRGGVEATFNAGTVIIKNSEGEETLSYTVSGNTVTVSHVSGAELGYRIKISEYYNVVLTYTDSVTNEPAELVLTPWSIYTELAGTSWIHTHEYEGMRGTTQTDYLITFDPVAHELSVLNLDSGFDADIFTFTVTDQGNGKYSFAFELKSDTWMMNGLNLNNGGVTAENCYFVYSEGKITEMHLWLENPFDYSDDPFAAAFEPDTWGM